MKLNVPDMSCGHCVSAIEKAVKALDDAAQVACDLDTKTVSVDSRLSADQIAEALKSAGYDTTPA